MFALISAPYNDKVHEVIPILVCSSRKEEKDSDKKGEGRSHGDLVMKGTNLWSLIRTQTQALDGLHVMTVAMGSELTKRLILLKPKRNRNQWAKGLPPHA